MGKSDYYKMKFNYCPTCKHLLYPERPPLEIMFLRLKAEKIGGDELGEFFKALDEALKNLPHLDKLEISYSEYGKEINNAVDK